jgi:hypothetical protein
MTTYAYGWTDSDVAHGAAIARSFGAEPRDIFGLWYHESGGLNPRVHPFGDYYGLIGGDNSGVSNTVGYSWASVVQSGSIAQQLDAIQDFWERQAATYLHESYASRASRIGATPAAMIYATNFVPAYAARVRSVDDVLIAGSDPYYAQNPAFANAKGYISVRDLEDKIAAMVQRGLNDPNVGAIFRAIPPPGVGAAFSRVWRSPAGKAATVAAGAAVLLGAAFYVKYGRLPTRRDLPF